MRLLILSQYFWPENFRVNDLTQELIARGHEVTVLTGQPNYPDGRIFADFRASPEKYAKFEGADVFRVPVIPRGQRSVQLVANYLSFVLSGWLLGPAKLRGREFDAIFVFQTSPITSALPALWLRWRRRTPVLMWVLDLWPDTLSAIGVVKSPRLLEMVGSLVRFIYRRCDRILVQSRAFFGNVERYAEGTENIRYFPGWAEAAFTEEALSVAPAPELEPYAEDFTILFAGNIGQAQDFPAIIAAADLLRDTPGLRWIVVGDGRAAEEAKADIARRGLGDRIVFLGRFPLERMPAFFNGADCLLVSLKNDPIWSMTIPGKVQSYLASGRPLLGMLDGEGANVIRESGAGAVGPASDPEALAHNVRSLMAMSPEARAKLGENGRHYCDREFNRTVLVDLFESWVEELGEARNGGR